MLAGVIGSGESIKPDDAGAADSFCGVYEYGVETRCVNKGGSVSTSVFR